MTRTVRSPDGRTWTLERVSPESSLGATMKEPFFWPSAIATIIILVPLLLIWFFERGLSFLRPNIRAHTDGPPAETHTWRTTHRIGLGRIENRIAEQIEQGHLEAEPAGAVLIGI